VFDSLVEIPPASAVPAGVVGILRAISDCFSQLPGEPPMSQNFRTLIVAAVIVLGMVMLNRAIPQQIPNAVQIDQWEYRLDRDNFTEEKANSLGKEGWELVTVYAQGGVRSIYKRPLR
jgi:hypothetical protein